MKDIEGALVHVSPRNAVPATLSPPSLPERTVDALRRPIRQAAHVALPYAAALGLEQVLALHPGNFVGFLVSVGGLGAYGRSLYCAFDVARQQINRHDSMVSLIASRVHGRESVASAAARMLRADWSRATITTAELYLGRQGSVGHEHRVTRIALPNGASVTVAYRLSKRPLVILDAKSRDHYRNIDPKDSLGRTGVAVVLGAIERLQMDRLCMLLGVPEGQSGTALSHMLADALPVESQDSEENESRTSRILLNDYTIDRIVEKRTIPGAEITVTSIRPKHGSDYVSVLVQAPGMGVLSLPTEPFGARMSPRRGAVMKHAFGIGAPEIMTLPVFQGNARATRLADLARQVLQEDPDLLDSSGSPLRKLVVEHMPRLLATHRDNTATARTSDIAEIDGALDRGLDIVARELGEALDRIADRKLDDLRTELRFLESRHPEQETRLSSIPAMVA
jgi:hypothetical protein